MQYAIVEISGRQYKVEPGRALSVDFLGDIKTLECDKVMLVSDGSKIELGKPYLKDKLTFDVLGFEKGKKIRVATYHAKANYRRVKGARRVTTTIKLQEDSVKK